MSLDLAGIFHRSPQLNTVQNAQTAGGAENVSAGRQAGGGEPLNLQIGATVSGTVEGSENNMVSIRLANGQTVLAQLEEALTFGKGESVTFSVSGMSDGQYILKSLFQNTAMQATGEKALMQAGIAVNENSLSMVSEMMEDGMPVDKNSLQAMYKDVVAHPETSGANIVAMNRLQIPVTDANVQQFQAYMNLEHQISEGVSDLADSLLEAFQDLEEGAGRTQADEMMKSLVMLLGEDAKAPATEQTVGADPAADGTETAAEGDVAAAEVQTGSNGAAAQIADKEQKAAVGMSPEQTIPAETAEAAQPQGTGASYLEALKKISMMQEGAQAAEMQTEQTPGEAAQAQRAQTGAEAGTALSDSLRQLGMGEESLAKLQSGELSDKELLGFVKDFLAEHEGGMEQRLSEHLHKLFDNREFQAALKNEMGRQLLLTPEHLASKEDVEAYYNKLNDQLGKMTSALSNVLPQDSAPMQQLSSMQDNLHFMEQMNQTMSYIQLPMKLLSDQAHGDLYVYTNKRNLADSDGTVSAFLHLDMDHLGPVDVYVAMQNKNVSTNFYLKDDEMIDFIAERIDQLNERLESKGYQMSAKITKKEKETSVMQEIIEDHKEIHMIGTQSFDVRA